MNKSSAIRNKTSKLAVSKYESKEDDFSSDSDIEGNFVSQTKKDVVKKSIKKYLTPIPKEETIDDLLHDAIDFINSLFNYCGKKFSFFKVKEMIRKKLRDVIYIRAIDIANFLEYVNSGKAVRDHVKKKYRKTLKKLLELQGGSNLDPPLNNFNQNDLDTIYVSEFGLYEFITKSKKPKAEPFQDYLFEVILPTIRETNQFNVKPKPIINKNTTPIESFLKHNNIEDYDKVPVVYLAALGFIGDDLLFKYGYTSDIIKRLAQHKTTFGDQFKLILIAQTDNNVAVEKKYKELIKEYGFNFEIEFGNNMQTELVRTHGDFTIDNAKGLLECLAENYISDSMQDVMEKYNTNKYAIKAQMKVDIEKEKTKQEEAIAQQKYEDRLKEEAIARQKEADRDIRLAELNKNSCVEEIKKEPKEQPIIQQNIYIIFLNEKTVESSAHTHTNVLYTEYVNWLQTYHPNIRVPSNVEFCKNIKKYKDIKKVRVNDKVSSGISNLELRP
jgi:prophage antirepressor-like protein